MLSWLADAPPPDQSVQQSEALKSAVAEVRGSPTASAKHVDHVHDFCSAGEHILILGAAMSPQHMRAVYIDGPDFAGLDLRRIRGGSGFRVRVRGRVRVRVRASLRVRLRVRFRVTGGERIDVRATNACTGMSAMQV